MMLHLNFIQLTYFRTQITSMMEWIKLERRAIIDILQQGRVNSGIDQIAHHGICLKINDPKISLLVAKKSKKTWETSWVYHILRYC